MPKQWDIVEVPGDVWPGDGGPAEFLAVVVSSQFASEKANIYWVCPIGPSKGKRMEPGYIKIAQYKPPAVITAWDKFRGRKLQPQPKRPRRRLRRFRHGAHRSRHHRHAP